jgi:hypothetical protein
MNMGGGQDIEVEDDDSSEDDLDYDGEGRLPFQVLLFDLTRGAMIAGQRSDTSSTRRIRNDSEPAGLDYRMANVVRRYEAHASEDEGHGRQEERETSFDVEALTSLTKRAMRMPTAEDPKFWIVSVYVSL